MNALDNGNLGDGTSGSSPLNTVYVIDDNAEVRKSLNFMLSACGITSWPFSSGDEFFDHLSGLKPAPILLDIRMVGMDGLEVLSELDARRMKWPVVVMSGHGDISTAVRAMKLGAIEFLEKPFELEALEASVALAQNHLKNVIAALAQHDSAQCRLGKLTSRENEVLRALISGAANKQVAYQLGLSTRTVEVYRANALSKLNVKSIAEVVALVALADQS